MVAVTPVSICLRIIVPQSNCMSLVALLFVNGTCSTIIWRLHRITQASQRSPMQTEPLSVREREVVVHRGVCHNYALLREKLPKRYCVRAAVYTELVEAPYSTCPEPLLSK